MSNTRELLAEARRTILHLVSATPVRDCDEVIARIDAHLASPAAPDAAIIEQCARVCDEIARQCKPADFDHSENASMARLQVEIATGCAEAIRALTPASGMVVPRELRELLDTVSALDTFNIEHHKDFSRMPTYIQTIHKRLFKEWSVVRAMLSAKPT